MADELWAADGLQALELSLVRSKADVALIASSPAEASKLAPFHPTFVYPIYGEEETIFGYRNLSIKLAFTSGSLHQYLSVTYDEKFPPAGGVEADDPEAKLFEFIPPSYTKNIADFEATVEREADTFQPLGEKIGAYRMKPAGKGKGKAKAAPGTLPDRKWHVLGEGEEPNQGETVYEAYKTTWDTPGFKEFHRRMQVFVLLYIEGASYIEEDDPRWEFLTLFEKVTKADGRASYHFVGFTSFYSFFCWPDSKRLRLSQSFILPPYQGFGHGSALYTLAYQRILVRPEISELTVEDPAEAFEDMRDKADLYTLISSGELDGLSAPIDRTVLEPIRKKWKLADRQFYRLVEMIFLLHLSSSSSASSPKDPSARAYRLSVKKRLYLFNREMLSQIEPDERKEKLQETFEGVEDDYRRILDGFRYGGGRKEEA